MWTIFKVLIESVTILLLFYVFRVFAHKACGILAPRPEIEPTPPALEGEVLTTGPPGKSLLVYFLNKQSTFKNQLTGLPWWLSG